MSSVGAKQAATTFTCADITALTAQLKDLIEDNPASLQVQAVQKFCEFSRDSVFKLTKEIVQQFFLTHSYHSCFAHFFSHEKGN